MKNTYSRARAGLACLLAATLGGCVASHPAPGSAAKAAPSDLDRITYSISSCRGTCPAYSVFMAADGNAYFEGERHTRTIGKTPVNGTPMLFAELKNRLSAIRPKQGTRAITHENCSVYSTDQQIVTLSWGWGFNEANVLSFDLGCHGPEHANTRAALSAARRLLPIDHLVGRPTEF